MDEHLIHILGAYTIFLTFLISILAINLYNHLKLNKELIKLQNEKKK